MRRSRLPQVPILVGAAFVGIVAVALVLWGGNRGNAGNAENGVEAAADNAGVTIPEPRGVPGKVLLLAAPDSDLPDFDHGGSPVNLVRVADDRELKAALDPTVSVVAVEKRAAATVDWAWMRARLDEGRVVAGINIHMNDLERYLGRQDIGSFGRINLETGFTSVLVGGAGSQCSQGIYSEGLIGNLLDVAATCIAPQFAGQPLP